MIWLLLLANLTCNLGCSGDDPQFVQAYGKKPVTTCTSVGISCDGDVATICNAAHEQSERDCGAEGQICAEDRGCMACIPGLHDCDGNTPRTCHADGSGWETEAACDTSAGLQCNRETGVCGNLCEQARQQESYIGCEYWPTVTANPNISREFSFAVAVSNPQDVPANVTVDRAGDAADVVAGPFTLEPDELRIIPLPWHEPLLAAAKDGSSGSLLAAKAAYHLLSDVPVTVYQFNALEYRIDRDCPTETRDPADGRCFSYTNDASLLVPTHALTGNYLVTSRASQLRMVSVQQSDGTVAMDGGGQLLLDAAQSPGFLAVVGVDEQVTVKVASSAFTNAAVEGQFPALAPGQQTSIELARGDVLQLTSQVPAPDVHCEGPEDLQALGQGYTRHIRYCNVGQDYDLTGTRIEASGKVAVLAGHACAFVPYNRWACDHLEESMFPMESWGREFAVGRTHALSLEPNVVRVLAARAGTMVSFEPEVHEPLTLGQGEFAEFEVSDDFLIHASEPISVAQFLVGQEYEGIGQSPPEAVGDPDFALVTPADQYRKRYNFLAPETYTENWITVVARKGQRVELDGRAVSRWARIGTTNMQASRTPLRAGSHDMRSDGPFGVTVYGFGAYTSYMYSAGLDFHRIAEVQ